MKLPFLGRNRVTQPWKNPAHYGLDLVGDDDKRVRAVCAGTVGASAIVLNKTDRTWEWGNYVRIDGADGNKYFYCHLASRALTPGQRVQEGDFVGIMGNTGKSFGAHLHLQIRNNANIEVNVADTLGVPNVIGVYSLQEAPLVQAPPPPQPKLYTVCVGPVTQGDVNQVVALADKLLVKANVKDI